MIRRSAGFRRDGMGEAQILEVEGIDEGIDEADGVLLGDVVIQGFGEKGHLVSISALDMPHR